MARTVWFPGHMAKGKRQLEALAQQLDIILEVRDARAPRLSASPVLNLFKGFKVWTILSKADLADPKTTQEWLTWFHNANHVAWALDLKKGIPAAFRKKLNSEKPAFRELRLAVVGTPNVGKSMLLNQLVGRKAVQVGGIPGITRGVSWFKGQGFLVVDSPGILDPHGDPRAHRMLSWIASTKGQVIGAWENHAIECLDYFQKNGLINKLESLWAISLTGDASENLKKIALRLGKLKAGGEPDLESAGKTLLEAVSTGKALCISLEKPLSPLPWDSLK